MAANQDATKSTIAPMSDGKEAMEISVANPRRNSPRFLSFGESTGLLASISSSRTAGKQPPGQVLEKPKILEKQMVLEKPKILEKQKVLEKPKESIPPLFFSRFEQESASLAKTEEAIRQSQVTFLAIHSSNTARIEQVLALFAQKAELERILREKEQQFGTALSENAAFSDLFDMGDSSASSNSNAMSITPQESKSDSEIAQFPDKLASLCSLQQNRIQNQHQILERTEKMIELMKQATQAMQAATQLINQNPLSLALNSPLQLLMRKSSLVQVSIRADPRRD